MTARILKAILEILEPFPAIGNLHKNYTKMPTICRWNKLINITSLNSFNWCINFEKKINKVISCKFILNYPTIYTNITYYRFK